jgi:hypothetical protein
MSLKIFDAHVHIGYWGSHVVDGKTISPFLGREMNSIDNVLNYLKKSQIERAVIVPIYSPDKIQAYHINTLRLIE